MKSYDSPLVIHINNLFFLNVIFSIKLIKLHYLEEEIN